MFDRSCHSYGPSTRHSIGVLLSPPIKPWTLFVVLVTQLLRPRVPCIGSLLSPLPDADHALSFPHEGVRAVPTYVTKVTRVRSLIVPLRVPGICYQRTKIYVNV